ncbi:hypothetical protein ACM64Y_13905 [Novispirillum sp. DQ9]|uniref:hypothetical protein n=1 Tax=Novispirillum sp. DQ9 TaxID=3398612 RepID=UPI003C7E6491
MFRKLMTGALALVAGVAAACEEAPRSTVTFMRPGGLEPFLAGIAAAGPLLVETVGPDIPREVARFTADTVAAALKGRMVATTPDPARATHPEFRVRVTYDAPASFNPNRLCAGEVPVAERTGDRLQVLAVFCQGEVLHAALIGSAPRPGSLTDDSVGKLLAQMARQMFSESA